MLYYYIILYYIILYYIVLYYIILLFDTGAWDTAPSLARTALQIPDARPVAPRDSAHPRVTRTEWLGRLSRGTRSAMCTPPRRPSRADRPTRACDAIA